VQTIIFNTISQFTGNKILLDSSKYIARYIRLKNNSKFKVKGIYMVRDVRGVVNSFGKQVQTPKKPLSAMVYYIIINTFAQILCWLDKDILKVRYEDFVSNPEKQLNYIIEHVAEGSTVNIDRHGIMLPHLIGGNRLKKDRSIQINPDLKWRELIPRYKQILYYIFCAPLMLLNRYKL
jgi:hypothetical protein